jgi:MSHA biogenesis protein MshL
MLAAALAALFAGCASTSAPPPTAVLDAIQREMTLATQPKAPAASVALDNALLPPLVLDAVKPAEARFDITVQNAPVSQVYNAIVVGTPFSMLVPPELSGTVTLNLKHVTVRDVLDAMRDLYGYEYKVVGDRIYPQSNAMQTRLFQVNYLSSRRQGSTNVSLTSTSITGGTNTPGTSGTATVPGTTGTGAAGATGGTTAGRTGGSSSVSTTTGGDFWKEIESSLKSLVNSGDKGGSVQVNQSSGVILVRAMPAELREVEKFLKATQGVIERQVMLEAKIMEVSLSDEYQAGVNWAAFRSTPSNLAFGAQGANTTLGAAARGTQSALSAPNLNITPGAIAGSVATGLARGFYGLAFQSANFAALLGFLESQGSVHVLSSPRVATLNNQKAVLKVGSDEFFVTNVSTTTTTGTGATTTSPTVTLQPFFSGIALDVTPQIDANDQIILHVHPSISTVSEKTKTIDLGAGGSLILPLAASAINESDAIVRVRDGQIVAIGGLMRQRQTGDRSGLPGTTQNDAGVLLGQRGRSMYKSELVILIKPTVLREDADWQASLQEVNQRLQEYAPPKPVRIIHP